MSRSQVEMWERLSSKANSDPILEHILASIPDPFDSYGAPASDDQILSIIPPSSLLSTSPGQLLRTGPTAAGGSAIGSTAAATALASREETRAEGKSSTAQSYASTKPTKGKATDKSPRLRDEALFEPSDSEDSRVDGDYAILTAPAGRQLSSSTQATNGLEESAAVTGQDQTTANSNPQNDSVSIKVLPSSDGETHQSSSAEGGTSDPFSNDDDDKGTNSPPGSPPFVPANTKVNLLSGMAPGQVADQGTIAYAPTDQPNACAEWANRSGLNAEVTELATLNCGAEGTAASARQEFDHKNSPSISYDSDGDTISDRTVDASSVAVPEDGLQRPPSQ